MSDKAQMSHTNTGKLSARSKAVAIFSKSGVVVSKTGGACRDPAAIIRSSTAQDQLKKISVIRKQIFK
jgi:hypothetical protein